MLLLALFFPSWCALRFRSQEMKPPYLLHTLAHFAKQKYTKKTETLKTEPKRMEQ